MKHKLITAPSLFINPELSIVSATAYSAFGNSQNAISVELSDGSTAVIHSSRTRAECEALADWLQSGADA